jgi:hypothetical protein
LTLLLDCAWYLKIILTLTLFGDFMETMQTIDRSVLLASLDNLKKKALIIDNKLNNAAEVVNEATKKIVETLIAIGIDYHCWGENIELPIRSNGETGNVVDTVWVYNSIIFEKENLWLSFDGEEPKAILGLSRANRVAAAKNYLKFLDSVNDKLDHEIQELDSFEERTKKFAEQLSH